MNHPFKPTDSPVWAQLARQQQILGKTRLTELFQQDPGRFNAMQAQGAGLMVDYSRNLLDRDAVDLLIRLAEDAGLTDRISALLNGDKVNTTEDRPALHTALRDFSGSSGYATGIAATTEIMRTLAHRLRSGEWKGCTGKPVTDVVNIGIGGSHLGPMMVTRALASPADTNIRCHFVSNLDSSDLRSTLTGLVPETTLFIVASKSFTTLETLENAKTARLWLEKAAEDDSGISRHFLAVTARPDKARAFGIAAENILPMWEWVGGRYSLWSAIGLPIAISSGMDSFNRLREGAAAMDDHFRRTPLSRNLPVLLALLDIWYLNFCGFRSHAVLPYVHRLRYFPEFLQQLEMESNGKSVRIDGRSLDYQTAGVVWGTVETNGQHSFHQLLHQGTQTVPVDFIVALKAETANDAHHPYLFANCLAQAQVLMTGRSSKEIKQDLIKSGLSEQQAETLAVHQQMPGNRPSTLIIIDSLSPESLGALIALYEHKVYVQSIIWGINPFDQYGVEWGKVIGARIYNSLVDRSDNNGFDPATEGLISLYKNNSD